MLENCELYVLSVYNVITWRYTAAFLDVSCNAEQLDNDRAWYTLPWLSEEEGRGVGR